MVRQISDIKDSYLGIVEGELEAHLVVANLHTRFVLVLEVSSR
jgi:hypothetical protein